MNTIKQTIQHSHLLSDQQKINLLVEVDGCSEEEIAKLDEVLTRHEEKYQALLAKYQAAVNKELAGILSDDGNAPAVREAVEKIRLGVKTIIN
ncbi:MAG: hypothetical protein Q8L37_03040 [Candidatus Gottesmanbacteria bacterium]|nr:hypothetical protein [Candidatus Gottesmanbacteria bacterium]